MASDNKIYLLPGELTIAQHTEDIWTVLGSCISIVLHSPRAGVSAVNHAQLPARGGSISCKDACPHRCGKPEVPDYKYVTCSFDVMWSRLMKMGISPNELQVSLYGGASMLALKGAGFSVGDKNIAAAEELIANHGLRIHHQDVGGHQSRKMLHCSETGKTQIIAGNINGY